MTSILTVVGARPQFIKAAAVSRAMRAAGVDEILVHTGQHYDEQLSAVFFTEMEIPPPSYSLGVGSGPHGRQTGRMLEAIEEVLLKERPKRVLVYGDTNSTLAGALAAAKLHIPVAHVEAGLRSFNSAMPEEINRVLTDHVADLLFAPTSTAAINLKREGIDSASIVETGDVMFDVSRYYAAGAERKSRILETLDLTKGSYVLATCHRAENADDPARLSAIVNGLNDVAESIPVILPLHPRTLSRLGGTRGLSALNNLRFIEPVGYLDMVKLERNAAVIATDSGGVQKEAFFYRVPCVTLRDETEWVELVELRWNRVVKPTRAAAVRDAVHNAIGTRGAEGEPYGRGDAADRIVAALTRN